ncbi:hypothetical protein [Methylocystis iwaonis]|uniref:MarR family transcriptional regulator n=1 Tax=Methylocystis iwaonis TaxID=2885079 RepID=A0ABM8ECE5_9HYPH|nr:hypothetical protein [Methylocystis iwaonis]BDV35680.1 hypothetical protein SS37A_32090 [Methylocystis iwaonis]
MDLDGCASDAELREDAGDWASMTDLACITGTSHQNISKRVAAFVRKGLLQTRRAGKTKLVHRPTYEALALAAHDPAQGLRLRHVKAASDSNPTTTIQPRDVAGKGRASVADYDDAAAREKNAKAALAELELSRRRGELVSARDLEGAAVAVGTSIAQRVAALKTLAGKLYAASKGGEEALAATLTQEVAEVCRLIGEDMQKLGEFGEAKDAAARSN